MTAPVMRDVDVVTQNRVASTQVETMSVANPSAAVTTADGKPVTLLDSATTVGNNLATAIATAGNNSTVVLSGTFNASDALITLQPGQTVRGSTPLIVTTPSGHRATVTTPSATVAANFTTNNQPTAAVAVSMATGSTLSGVTVNATFTGAWCLGCNTVGVILNNANNVTLTNNTITFSSPYETSVGIRLTNGSTNATISGNTVSVSGAGGANKYGILIAGGANSATISNNSLSATDGTTNYAAYLAGATMLPGSTGNVFAAGGCGNGGGNTNPLGHTGGNCGP